LEFSFEFFSLLFIAQNILKYEAVLKQKDVHILISDEIFAIFGVSNVISCLETSRKTLISQEDNHG